MSKILKLTTADDPALIAESRLARLREWLGDEEQCPCMSLPTAPHREPPTFDQMIATVQRRKP